MPAPLKLQARLPLRTLDELIKAGLVTATERDNLLPVTAEFATSVTPAMRELIDDNDPDDPIARQFVPSTAELAPDVDATPDPIGDARHTPVAGVVHRYPDRVLLLPVRVCAVYCRFCFRRETVGSNAPAMLTPTELRGALDYIRAHTEIWEVILSGGDPLLMSPRRLGALLRELAAIEHVHVIRVHTRVPVVAPERITERLTRALAEGRGTKAAYVVVHSNHPREFSGVARAACARLVDAGVPLLSQTVLLRGVNDNAATLAELMRIFVANRIKPYYLHHPDRTRGTQHFRVSLAEGRRLVESLRGRLSGLCQPEYVLDIPGGFGKVPAGRAWIRGKGEGCCEVTDFRGAVHQYTDTDADGLD